MPGMGRSSSTKRLLSTAAGGICLDIHLRQRMALSATASVVATPVLSYEAWALTKHAQIRMGLLFKAFAPIRSARGSCVPV
jgi:hypothetical protein